MHKRQPKSWILALSLVCALLYGALQYAPQNMLSTDTRATARKVFPQSYMTDITDRRYDQNGTLERKLVAQRVNSFATKTATRNLIFEPQVTLYNKPGQAPWHLSAQRGVSVPDTITLQNNVQVWNTRSAYGRLTFITDDLIIDTAARYAHTDKPVIMRSEHGITRAVGLNAELGSGRLTLLSEVEARYAP